MPWVVDTCVLLDVLEDDPAFGLASASELDRRADDGLAICAVSYAELSPAFGGDRALQDEFLAGVGIGQPAEWEWADSVAAHGAWFRYIGLKRAGRAAKRPIADILIGAYATRRAGLITRNAGDFAPTFPDLLIVAPAGR